MLRFATIPYRPDRSEGPLRDIDMKTPQKKFAKLSNGLEIIHLHTENDPVSACHLLIPGGSSRETPSQAGITSLLWSLFLKGTTSQNARTIVEKIEGIGASIGAGATHDYSPAYDSALLHALAFIANTNP